jgi:hypothetical protein
LENPFSSLPGGLHFEIDKYGNLTISSLELAPTQSTYSRSAKPLQPPTADYAIKKDGPVTIFKLYPNGFKK